MEQDLDGNPLGWTTEVVDDREITVFRVPPGAKLRIKMPDGNTCEITAPPKGLVFIAEKDFDEIEAVNQALRGEPN